MSQFPPGFENDSNTLAIDFDGVIHTYDKGYHDGTCYGDPIPGALEAIRKLSKRYKIVIYTAKALPDRPPVEGKTGTQLVLEWLNKHGIYDCIAMVTAWKPRAFLYIDDNAYRFENWNSTLEYLDESK